MNTYRIKENDIKGLKPLAVGYKVFKNDWTSKHGYDYKDENGNVEGTIHRVDGEIEECEWGLHFSKQPQHCFNFYECVQWNKFAMIEAFEKCIDSSDGDKSIAKVIKIIKTFTFDEFIREIQNKLQTRGANESCGVNCSDGVNCSGGVNGSNGVNDSSGVNYSNGVNCSGGVNGSDGVNCSGGVNLSCSVNDSNGVKNSDGVNSSGGVNLSCGVNKSRGVNESCGVNSSNGVNKSYGINQCSGISHSVFCFGKSGEDYLFNKKSTAERVEEILNQISVFCWAPKYNNAFDLKGNLEWYETNIPGIVSVDNKTAWSFMPKKMLKYLKSLPEFNQKVFDKVTGN